MRFRLGLITSVAALFAFTAAGAAAEAPKQGGTLTYLIPADAPPSLDGHRETTYVTVHSAAPFYSVLIRIDPENPSSTTDFVCDLCTGMPQPTDGGKTYIFKIRQGVKFHDGSPLTAADVAASWNSIIHPQEGVLSPRQSNMLMVDTVEASDPETVVFRLKFGQSISGTRNPDYYHPGKPYLDGFTGIYAPKQATRIDALRSDRAAIEFRGMPPAARDQLKQELGDKIAVQESDWNCGSVVTINEAKKPFDDVRVRRALTLAIDRWHGAASLSKIATVRTVGTTVFPGDPLAPTKEEMHEIAGYWTDIEKSRTEARRLLKEAGAEGLSFELLNRDVDQPYKYVGIWIVDEWTKIGLKVTQRVLPTGPWFEAERSGNFAVDLQANCHSVVNPIADVQPYLPSSVSEQNYGNYEDPQEMAIYERLLHEPDPAKQHALMLAFDKHVLDVKVHKLVLPWWYRIVPYRSYVKGWKISTSHYINQDLSTIWLDK